jgi:hypothetical protein
MTLLSLCLSSLSLALSLTTLWLVYGGRRATEWTR